MRKRQQAVSHSSSSLNGLFKEVYEKKIVDLIPSTNVIWNTAGQIEKRPGYTFQQATQLNLESLQKSMAKAMEVSLLYGEGDYQVLVHPDTYKKYMEDTMALNTCEGQAVEASPVEVELNHLKYRVKELRDGIARKQEQLRIELAKLAAVKKLAKGGK